MLAENFRKIIFLSFWIFKSYMDTAPCINLSNITPQTFGRQNRFLVNLMSLDCFVSK